MALSLAVNLYTVVEFGVVDLMKSTAIVNGRVISFDLSPGLAAAHRRNRNRRMTPQQAVMFVENRRRERARRAAEAHLESRA
jgi:hypothetical protein